MKKTKCTLIVLATLAFIIACATAGQASAQRTFVAGPGIGSDANTASDCSFSAPCRNFSAAFGVTNSGGEIIALSSAGYGGLTITKPITIESVPGQLAFVAVGASGTGIVVNTAGANDLVILRNVQFNGSNAGSNTGVSHLNGRLSIENCTFSALAVGASITKKTIIRNSSFDGNGLAVSDTGALVDLESVTVTNNNTALEAHGNGGSDVTPANGPTQLRFHSGIIFNNNNAFAMFDAGLVVPSGQCNAANIFLRSSSEGVHIIGNNAFALTLGTTASSCFPRNVGFVSQQQAS
jgi:hypothetical protein